MPYAARRGGPAPNMNALVRERDWRVFTRLPRECTKPEPDWPIEVPNPTVAELAMWSRLWRMPQAHVWHADHLETYVALYARAYVEAAQPKASSIARTTVRQMMGEMLLTTQALNAAKYVIVDSDEDEVLQGIAARQTGTEGGDPARPGPGGARRSARSRMRVVGGTGPAPIDDNDVSPEEDTSDPDA